MSGEEGCRHPDALISQLIADPERSATAREVVEIIEHISRAPFNARRINVPSILVGREFLGRRLGAKENSLTVHVAQRVLRDAQWGELTAEGDFLDDVRRAVLHPDAALAVYETRRTDFAAVVAPNIVPRSRLGKQPGKFVVVPYSANRGRIISAWQAKDEDNLLIPERARWIKPPKESRS